MVAQGASLGLQCLNQILVGSGRLWGLEVRVFSIETREFRAERHLFGFNAHYRTKVVQVRPERRNSPL
jgi:hypothetical protein